MLNELISRSLSAESIKQLVLTANETTLANSISKAGDTLLSDPTKLTQLGFIYESLGIKSYAHWVATQEAEGIQSSRLHFKNAFYIWKALSKNLPVLEGNYRQQYTQFFDLPTRPTFPHELTLVLRLAVSGVLSQATAETRLELEKIDFVKLEAALDWGENVANSILIAFVLLTRKANGWDDINEAISRIEFLRKSQEVSEAVYLNKTSTGDETLSAIKLVGLYHLAQMITITGDYLLGGESSLNQINLKLDRHRERATEAFDGIREVSSSQVADLLWVGCRELAQNSIWTHVNNLGKNIREYAGYITSSDRPNPVIELWPSQQEALQKNLLDAYRTAVIVEMPTSSGKTLLAKFSIIQAHSLNPDGTTAYVVPTRALVNQITFDLRNDFSPLNLSVEQAVPAYEMDPTEEKLLSAVPKVLVTTPEKLDFLIKRNHVSVKNLMLVIADEAHNLSDGDRGARLELLLAMIKRDKPKVRFLLLSPFLPNSAELVNWLGGNRALPPIKVNWKPGNKVVGAVKFEGRGSGRALFLKTLPSVDNSDILNKIDIPIARGDFIADEDNSIHSLSKTTSKALSSRGATLILCRGKGTAINRAYEIALETPKVELTTELNAVLKYIKTEIGFSSNLIYCLERGIAYHHADMSQELRWLIENLIKRRL